MGLTTLIKYYGIKDVSFLRSHGIDDLMVMLSTNNY